ncbi:MAG: alpha/beta hydrolase-fold protein [Hyphomonadaceae bacterium]
MIRRPMLMLLVLAACASPSAVAPPPIAVTAAYDERSLCAEAPAESPICVDDVSDIDETTARVVLGDQELVVRREGDRLTAFARVAAESASLCCSLQGEMTRIAETDLFVARYRLARLDEAVLTFVPSTWLRNQREFRMEDQPRWIGPNAPPPPPVVTELRGQRFERTLWSEYLGETRRLYFYLPPGHDRTRTYPVVFMADGASVMVLAPMFERLIDDGKIAPVIFAGAASGREAIVEDRSSLGISDIRAADYLPGREERIPRFEQHLRFFSEELVDYASREFGGARDPAQRVVTGFSNGGSFSLFAALRRPDVFGISMPLSPSWRALPEEDLSRPLRARFLMSAGPYEIGRQRRASQYAETLRSRGFDVTMQTPAMGHDRDQEAAMLAQYLPMVFPPALR